MIKNCVSVVVVLMGALLGLTPLTLFAQKAGIQKAGIQKTNKTTTLKIGAVNISFGGSFLRVNRLHFLAGVQMTSAQYDLMAEDVQATLSSPKSGHTGLAGATAEGSAAKKTQVIANVKQPLQGEAFEIFADHAVYVPDYTRPGGGRIDFTGHVMVLSRSGFLAGPAPADFGNGPVTVLLGQGEDYPQLQTGPGHIVVTPAQ